MPKIRVYELAKKLNVSNKDLIKTLENFGIEVKNHMSTVGDEHIEKITNHYAKANSSSSSSIANTENKADVKNETVKKEIQKGDSKQYVKQEKAVEKSNTAERPKEQNRNNAQNQSDKKPYYRNNEQRNDQRPQRQGDRREQRPYEQRNPQQRQGGYNNNQQQRTDNRNSQNNSQQSNNQNNSQSSNQQRTGGYNNNQQQRPSNYSRQNQQRPNNARKDQRTDYNDRQKQPSTYSDNRNSQPRQQGSYNSQPKPPLTPVKPLEAKTNKPQREQPKSKYNNPKNDSKNQKEEKLFNKNQTMGKNKKNNKHEEIKKPMKEEQIKPVEEEKIELIEIGEEITLKELAEKMHKSGADLVKHLFKKGMMVSINQTIDFDAASDIAEEFDILVEKEVEKDIFEEAFFEEEDKPEDLVKRPPVVVVMGHVDHGKTSLLDSIRHSKVTAGEAGGITQHIGAYTVSINGNPITFLDTPGHEAFTAMRMRGAQITDVAVLVVAADDGVMPQTIEAINHAKAAGVEIIVAINKIDKPSANPDRVKQELIEYGLLAEDWGGETICVPVSAVTHEGLDSLLEMIILATEMKELKANPNKKARGAIIEAQLDKGRGPVATVLVQSGTLNIGDPVVAGPAYGKIRAMMDDKGRRVKKAGPSTPVEVLGLSEVPSAGDSFYVASSEKQARQVAESVVAKSRVDMIKNTPQKVSLDDLFTQIQSGNMKEINIVVKADVQGSTEAVRQSLERLSNEEVRVRIIHGGVGTITESDVMLASASNAIIIGFNVRPEPAAKTFADAEKVDIRLYRVIYQAIDDVKAAMTGMLDPIYEEQVIGHAQIRQLFKASGVGTIAGSYVTDGRFVRNCQVRIIRDSAVIHQGDLESLKRFKDDVKEVKEGYECGLVIKKYNDLKVDDVVEAYMMVEVPRK